MVQPVLLAENVGTPSPHSLTLAGGEEEGERKKHRKSTHGSGAA